MPDPTETLPDDPVVERLDRITELLQVAFKPQLDAGRDEFRSDPTDAAIFDLTAGSWVAAGELQKRVEQRVGTKKSAIKNHLAALIDTGLLHKRGAGPSTEYSSAGLI